MNIVYAVAVVLLDSDKRVLICQRPEGKFMAGYWEFPGGKIEPGETPEQAARREIKEEVGVDLECMTPFSFISETRDDHHALVLIYICREWEGIPQSQEGQPVKWVRPMALKDYKLLPGNIPLIATLRDYI